MKNLNLFFKTITTGFCLVSATVLKCNAEQPKRPNVIIILSDDQGWGDMGYYDHPALKTPNLDEMSKSGIRFDHFYAAAPVCSPTRGSIMTGRHPNRYGIFTWGNFLRPQEITLAEILQKSGYITGHFGKWHLGPVYDGSPINPGNSGFDEWLSAPNFYDNDAVLSRQGTAIQMKGESSMIAADAAIEFITRHKNSKNSFFAFVCFGSPHLPHVADEQDKNIYSDKEENFQNYYGEITGIDRAVGKIRKELRNLEISDNTLIWYLSDNGGIGDVSITGGRGTKGSIYEGGLRVPSIFEWPDMIRKPAITNIPCSTSDIFPTILEIVGLDKESFIDNLVLDGISLVPLINGKMESREKPIGFWQYMPAQGLQTPTAVLMPELLKTQQAGNKVTDPKMLMLDSWNISKIYSRDTFPGHSAWLDWPYKLHRIQNGDSELVFELYNLLEDPMEEIDISNLFPEKVKNMRFELEQWLLSVVNSLNGTDYIDYSFFRKV